MPLFPSRGQPSPQQRLSVTALLKDTTLIIVDVSHGSLKVFACSETLIKGCLYFSSVTSIREGSAHKQRTVGKQFRQPDTLWPDNLVNIFTALQVVNLLMKTCLWKKKMCCRIRVYRLVFWKFLKRRQQVKMWDMNMSRLDEAKNLPRVFDTSSLRFLF